TADIAAAMCPDAAEVSAATAAAHALLGGAAGASRALAPVLVSRIPDAFARALQAVDAAQLEALVDPGLVGGPAHPPPPGLRAGGRRGRGHAHSRPPVARPRPPPAGGPRGRRGAGPPPRRGPQSAPAARRIGAAARSMSSAPRLSSRPLSGR